VFRGDGADLFRRRDPPRRPPAPVDLEAVTRTRAALLLSFLLTRSGSAEDAPKPHSFWDTTNLCLFGGIVAARALDYDSTQHFRRRGLNEVLLNNDIVDNKPLFGVIEIEGAAVSIAVSYYLHQHSHHRLERALSGVHIGITTIGAVRNYNLRPHK